MDRMGDGLSLCYSNDNSGNKKAFQSNSNCPLTYSRCFIVNKFERVGGVYRDPLPVNKSGKSGKNKGFSAKIREKNLKSGKISNRG